MTSPARIPQADFTRATKALVAAGKPGRVIVDLQNQRIEIIIDGSPAPPAPDEWTDDD